MDAKCASCGNWTRATADEVDGLYNDGSELEPLCECEGPEEEEDE